VTQADIKFVYLSGMSIKGRLSLSSSVMEEVSAESLIVKNVERDHQPAVNIRGSQIGSLLLCLDNVVGDVDLSDATVGDLSSLACIPSRPRITVFAATSCSTPCLLSVWS